MCVRERERVCVCVCVRESVCVCVRERESGLGGSQVGLRQFSDCLKGICFDTA